MHQLTATLERFWNHFPNPELVSSLGKEKTLELLKRYNDIQIVVSRPAFSVKGLRKEWDKKKMYITSIIHI